MNTIVVIIIVVAIIAAYILIFGMCKAGKY